METLPLPAIIALIVAAVVFGLWVGHCAGKFLPAEEEGKKKKSIGTRVRQATTNGIIKLWKWNRNREKSKD